jgi:hypothetical protein
MDDFQEARFGEGLEDEPEESAKAYYDSLWHRSPFTKR